MSFQSIGIIGYGQFGRFLEELASTHLPGAEIRVYSRRHPAGEENFKTFEETCRADMVIIATAIREFDQVIEEVIPRMRENAMLVELNTVKEYPVNVLKKKAQRVHYLATHPMFGPYSYEKQGYNLKGLRLVIADHNLSDEQFNIIHGALTSLGLSVLTTTAKEHDHLLAETLFLTHYLSQSVARADFIRTDIDTLSFGYLMDAVESVKNDGNLFRDVYHYVPHCRDVIDRFHRAQEETQAFLESSTD